MNRVFLIVASVLMLPALFVIGIALGPAALVMLFVIAIALPIVWLERKVLGSTERMPPAKR